MTDRSHSTDPARAFATMLGTWGVVFAIYVLWVAGALTVVYALFRGVEVIDGGSDTPMRLFLVALVVAGLVGFLMLLWQRADEVGRWRRASQPAATDQTVGTTRTPLNAYEWFLRDRAGRATYALLVAVFFGIGLARGAPVVEAALIALVGLPIVLALRFGLFAPFAAKTGEPAGTGSGVSGGAVTRNQLDVSDEELALLAAQLDAAPLRVPWPPTPEHTVSLASPVARQLAARGALDTDGDEPELSPEIRGLISGFVGAARVERVERVSGTEHIVVQRCSGGEQDVVLIWSPRQGMRVGRSKIQPSGAWAERALLAGIPVRPGADGPARTIDAPVDGVAAWLAALTEAPELADVAADLVDPLTWWALEVATAEHTEIVAVLVGGSASWVLHAVDGRADLAPADGASVLRRARELVESGRPGPDRSDASIAL